MLKSRRSPAASGKVVERSGQASLSTAPVVTTAVAKLSCELLEVDDRLVVCRQALGHLSTGVKDGVVASAAERATDLGQRGTGELACEPDREVPRPGDPSRAAVTDERGGLQPETGRHGLLDLLDRDGWHLLPGTRAGRLRGLLPGVAHAREHPLGEGQVDGLAGQGVKRDHPDQRALECAHVLGHALGDQLKHAVFTEWDAVERGALSEDGEARGQVGRQDVGDQAGLEALPQALLDPVELGREAIARDDELPAAVLKGVEGVEELLGGLGLAGEELHVVDQQDVDVPVGLLEALELAARECAHEVVGEGFDGRVAHTRVRGVGEHVVADRVKQMALAEPGRRVQEEDRIGLARLLSHGESGGMGQPVALADHELVEAVARVQRSSRRVDSRLGGDRSPGAGWPLTGEADLDVLTQDRPCAAIEHAAIALAQPSLSLARSLQDERLLVQRIELEGLDPDGVHRVAERPAQPVADLAPDRGDVEMRGQLQATPSGSFRGTWARWPTGGRPEGEYTSGARAWRGRVGRPWRKAREKGPAPSKSPEEPPQRGCVYLPDGLPSRSR